MYILENLIHRVWVKLGAKGESSDFYLLNENCEIRLGTSKFAVERTFKRPFPICYNCNEKFVNSVFVPCYHSEICYQCAFNQIKCHCGSKELKKLIDL